MAKQRPINAEVPAARPPEADASAPAVPPPPPGPASPRQRSPRVPLALKLVAAAVLIAIAFVVAAILGGTGGDDRASPSPAPAPTTAGDEGGAETEAAPTAEELGFPAFATKNTTRVGGGDPASNAAGVALATFPASGDGRRPGAVTLVDEGDWRAAIAAAVLVAAPVSAPILISTADQLPEPTLQALDALDPSGSRAGRGAQAFALGDVAAPEDLQVTRIRGAGSAAMAAAIVKLRNRLFGAAPEHIVIASAEQAAFAMPAAAWAARSGDPILFARRGKLPAPTAAALKRHADTPVYVLGPQAAISAAVLREIAAINRRVRRVAGADPVASSVAFARHREEGFGWGIVDPGHGFVIARNDSPLDAAAAAPLSASGTWGPLLISDDADTLPPVLRDYLLDLKPGYTDDPTRAFYNHVWVIGDQEAIEVTQQGEIDELAELARIGGG